MTTHFTGFPIQHELNIARNKAWKKTYEGNSTGRNVADFVIHKELSIVCAVTNTASLGLGATGFVVGAAVLGTPKIVTFIFTAGNVRPKYSTGCLYSLEVVGCSITNIFANVVELGYDCGYIGYKCGKGIQWTAKQLRLNGILTRIAKETFTLLAKEAIRVAKGTENAIHHEPKYAPGSPILIAWINEPTKNLRIDFSASERSVIDILSHSALSVVNIPVNVFTCGVAGAAFVPLAACFTGKVVINSITTLDVPVPTYAGAAIVLSGKAFFNVFADIGTIAADTGVLIYKGANILRINTIMASALEFLYWSVGAIFS